MKFSLKPLAKNVWIPLRLTVKASSTDAAIQKKHFVFYTTLLVFPNEDSNDIMKIVKSLKNAERSIYWSKTLMKQLKTKKNNKKGDFLACS